MQQRSAPQRFPWTRFWYPRETAVPITEGFLYVPDGRYAAYHASPYKTLEALHNYRCLILLGEPGVGKSDTLEHTSTNAGGRRLYEDLGGLATQQEVREYIFEQQVFQNWLRERTAKALAKEMGLTVIRMHEPNHSHFFASWGILPEEEPVGYLGFLEVEPEETSDDLLLQHGWRSLAEATTLPLAVCRSVLRMQGVIGPSGWVTTSEVASA